MTEQSHAVFLSYASQDAEAARKIGEALRAAGIEVFLDQSELRGGDAWDKKIRHEIHDCVLFIPIVSQHTQERLEGYFRHEWKLAIERAHHMAAQKAFLVPVVVDGTGDQEAFVPDEFREVQWTRLPAGEMPPEFVARIRKLLSGESGPLPTMARKPVAATSRRSSLLMPAVLAVALAAVAAYLLIEKPWTAKFAPPAHSVAVLPFANLSGDKEQEYFSDGLTEELLNSLSQINDLQVAARTSAFSFKGKDIDIDTIAHKLNVAAVLEGSVRRSEHTMRVTAQLINAVTGFHLWSKTYDRDIGDVLKLQTEIATAVAGALKVTLFGDIAQKIEIGGTRNPAAFDAYLRATKTYWETLGEKETQTAIDGYSEAIRLDPDYALAYAARSLALVTFAQLYATSAGATASDLDKALTDAHRAIALAPNLTEGHLALAGVYEDLLEFARANEEYARALTLGPGSARALRDYGVFAAYMGRGDSALKALHQAVVLDSVNANSYVLLADGLGTLRRYKEAIEVLRNAPGNRNGLQPEVLGDMGVAYYKLGDLKGARASCEGGVEEIYDIRLCLALTYEKLGRHGDADTMLAKIRAQYGDAGAVGYSEFYAQRGDTAQALDWLEMALRQRNPDLRFVKTDALFDPLRKEPRFQAIERALKFPD